MNGVGLQVDTGYWRQVLSRGMAVPADRPLAALTAEAAARGGFYHTHVRYPLGDRYLDPFREAIEIGRRGQGPVHITHFYHRETHPGGPQPMLQLVEDARSEGLDVTFDTGSWQLALVQIADAQRAELFPAQAVVEKRCKNGSVALAFKSRIGRRMKKQPRLLIA
jgi:hypothetical protein